METSSDGEVIKCLDYVDLHTKSGNKFAVGFVPYHAAPGINPLLVVNDQCKLPKVWFGIYDSYREVTDRPTTDVPPGREWLPDTLIDDYTSKVENIREHIARGDVYQTNYTIGLNSQVGADAYELYRELLQQNRNAGYCAYVNLPGWQILSISPELFYQSDADTITVKPMKGTIGRAPTLTADNSRIEQLRNSEKDRAEHLMIVDLMRNDLGKIAQIGSVNVRNLFGVETYETVHQMVSTIDAKLLPGITLAGVLTALFPSGSVTGAPKVASMALIKGIETRCRAIYCGSIGFVKPGGDCMFNVGIRTVLVNSETLSASCGVGGAIVWDSRPDQEWNEALLKSRFLTKHRSEFALLESVLLNDGEYVYLDRHMRRLTDSTSYFGFKIYPNAIIEGLAKIKTKNARGSVNVRIIAHSDGHFETMAAPVSPFEIEPLIVSVSDQPIDCADPLFYHKTTNRRPYEDRLAMFPACSEVLLVNTRQEVTEFTIGNIVVELDGELWTPPIYCGLLPGILREVMIEECVIRERVLTVNDIRHASRVWRINSVRGWTPVQFKELVQKI